MPSTLRHALRSLAKSPGFTATTVLTLALGLGACTAIFTVLYAVLLRPFPYPEAERLVVLSQKGPQMEMSIAWPTVQDWAREQRTFTALGAYRRNNFNLSGAGQLPENVNGTSASAALFDVASLPAVRGRYFGPDEDRAGAAPVVVISEKLWQRRYGRDPQLVGRTIPVDGVATTVIGIAPAALNLPGRAELWVPLAPYAATQPSWQSRGNNPGIYAVGRLRPDATLEQARADFARIYVALRAANPGTLDGVEAQQVPFLEFQTRNYRFALWSLLAATGLVLAIACANVASLYVTRGLSQERDYAVRSALGASRAQLIRHMLLESLLVSLAGGALAVLLAAFALDVIRAYVPANNLRFAALDLNPWVIGFALLLATVSGALAGLWPAWKLSRADLRTSLHDGGRAATSGSALRRVLVGAQVALTLVLLSVSGLILRSLDRMQAAPLGYDPRSLLVFSLALPENRYGNTPDRARDFYFQLVDKLRTLPGVTDAAVTTTPPLETGWQSSFAVEGVHRPTENNLPLAEMNLVTDDYFRTLGVPLLQGRSFLPTDQKGPPVAIIDQAFAQKYWPGKSALGQRIHWTMGETEADNWFTVVGIVPTLQVYGYGEAPVRPQAYLTSRQFCPPAQIVVVRTTGNPRLLEREVRQVLAALEPEISLFDLTTMEEMIASTYQNTALQSRLLTAFSVLAFLLALTGLYSVVAYGVGLRQREIGVRLALGADGASVVRLMLRQGLVPLAVGALVGLAGAILAGRAVQSQLYQVSPLDPLTLIAATLVLALAAAVASWLPARRAAQVDPMIALRAE